jgi:hypothetical protein
MSARNGDKSRFNRERKQNIARRMRTRELLKGAATQPKATESRISTRQVPVSA